MRRFVKIDILLFLIAGLIFEIQPQIIIPGNPYEDMEKEEKAPEPEKVKPGTRTQKIISEIQTLLKQNAETKALPAVAYQLNYRHHPLVAGAIGMDVDSQVSIASTSKTMTGMVMIQFMRMGLIDIDDPISKYLPEAKNLSIDPNKQITIRHLLQHRSGIPYTAKNRVKVAGLSIPMPKLPPGVSFQYANPNFNLLAKIVEKISKQPFYKAVQLYVVEPFRLNGTLSGPGASGAAGIRSTVQDLSILADFLIKDFKQKGRKSWLAELALNPEGIPSTGNQSYYGLGWRVTLRNGEIFSMHHYGDWHKGVCIFYVFPLHSASFAYVATPPDYSARQVQNVKLALINYAQDYADSLDRTSNPQVSSSGLNIIKDKSKLYIGSYTNSRTNESVNIFSKDGQLYLKRSDREVPLKYLSDWEFEGDSTEYSVQFYFDENAKVRAVIDMGDYFQKN
ncbi:MAG: serine hydrolase [Leptospiraceae bacterium]|nr:serine hydrolase [Leptospiraceae bacterium]MCB1201375.1 serine hydrolase [Leptospiraceae bacterium]